MQWNCNGESSAPNRAAPRTNPGLPSGDGGRTAADRGRAMLHSRYWVFVACIALTLLSLAMAIQPMHPDWWWPTLVFGGLTVLGVIDLLQKRHAVRRNYPVIARFRYLLEEIGP